ncbi:MAG: carbon storage regulator, CsrA [Chlamydiales bacterium]|jgi:carbon storage regulator|nr:carbon storage regulator, CsrA [Chlamydiales bacterium]
MLVLTRKSEQKIYIGKDIVITILKVQGDCVSIGIEAPKSTPIYREEVLKEIEKENLEGVISSQAVDLKSLADSLQLKGKKKAPVRLSSFKKKETP